MNYSDVVYSFTRLNSIKPEMIAEANRAARRNAEQFAKDSGAGVGAIKSASQDTSRWVRATATAMRKADRADPARRCKRYVS